MKPRSERGDHVEQIQQLQGEWKDLHPEIEQRTLDHDQLKLQDECCGKRPKKGDRGSEPTNVKRSDGKLIDHLV